MRFTSIVLVCVAILSLAVPVSARHMESENWVVMVTQLSEGLVDNANLPVILAVLDNSTLSVWVETEVRPDALGALGLERFTGKISVEDVPEECQGSNPHPDQIVAQLCITELVIDKTGVTIKGFTTIGDDYYVVSRLIPSTD